MYPFPSLLLVLVASVFLLESPMKCAFADIVVPDEPGSEYSTVFYADGHHVYKRRCSTNESNINRECVQKGSVVEFGSLPPVIAMSISEFRKRYIGVAGLAESSDIPEKYTREGGRDTLYRDIEITESYLGRSDLGVFEQNKARERLDELKKFDNAISASSFLNNELFSHEVFYLLPFDSKFSTINLVFKQGFSDVIIYDRTSGWWWGYLDQVTPRQALDMAEEGSSKSLGCKTKFKGQIAGVDEAKSFARLQLHMKMIHDVWRLSDHEPKLWDGSEVYWRVNANFGPVHSKLLIYSIKRGYDFWPSVSRGHPDSSYWGWIKHRRSEPKRGEYQDFYDGISVDVLCVTKPRV